MALATTYGQKSPVAAVVSLSGAMGLAEMRTDIRDASAPPAIVFRCENDLPGICPISRELHLHMASLGVDHESYVVEGGTHFYRRGDIATGEDGRATTVEDALTDFLRTRLAGAA
ncbi:hypothetical protein BH10PSE18_BH10PSE18_13730 [soil metagenome]